jgi:hypothetical protein
MYLLVPAGPIDSPQIWVYRMIPKTAFHKRPQTHSIKVQYISGGSKICLWKIRNKNTLPWCKLCQCWNILGHPVYLSITHITQHPKMISPKSLRLHIPFPVPTHNRSRWLGKSNCWFVVSDWEFSHGYESMSLHFSGKWTSINPSYFDVHHFISF